MDFSPQLDIRQTSAIFSRNRKKRNKTEVYLTIELLLFFLNRFVK
jgi:hypothetical protein